MWIPGMETRYFNPILGRVSGAVVGNQLAYALQEGESNIGTPARFDDIPTRWLLLPGVQLRRPAIVPAVQVSAREAR